MNGVIGMEVFLVIIVRLEYGLGEYVHLINIPRICLVSFEVTHEGCFLFDHASLVVRSSLVRFLTTMRDYEGVFQHLPLVTETRKFSLYGTLVSILPV